MPRYIPVILFFTVFFAACESSHEKISRLQSDFLMALEGGDFFEIPLGKEKLKLPLPPAPEMAAQRQKKIAALQGEAQGISTAGLSPEDQRRLTQLTAQLDEMVKRGGAVFFDPVRYDISGVLQENVPKGGNFTRILLEKIPAYYAEIERRWQSTTPARADQAANKSVKSLELLEKMGSEADAARLSVKDFIGHCHSEVLQ